MTAARLVTATVAAAALLAACSAPDDLRDGVMDLPRELREVSGAVAADASTIACVQDERGAILFVDVVHGGSVRTVGFGPPGDFEALARAGDEWWVLRSDGRLLRLGARGDGLGIAATVVLPAGHGEWEALCADPERARLLVMPKHGARTGDGPDRRSLFAVELPAGTLSPQPVLVLDRDAVEARAVELGLMRRRKDEGGKGRRRLELAVGEILAVPGTRDLLVLSAADGLLLRIDATGHVVGGRVLDAEVLPQPEGLTLLPDGRLVVASEGAGGRGRLAVVPMP